MNITLDNLAPLPRALELRGERHPRRRHRIGDHAPDHDALRHFNELLQTLAFPKAPIEPDQLATAAREIIDAAPSRTPPRCIQQRMRRGAAIDMMAGDPDWEARDDAAMRAWLVVADYLRGNRAVIPNALPVVGRLDDAIVVEAAWPAVAAEVRQYLAFCRIRHVEAQLRGASGRHFGFSREQWLEALRAEAEWIDHCGRVAQDSYLPGSPASGFRVT